MLAIPGEARCPRGSRSLVLLCRLAACTSCRAGKADEVVTFFNRSTSHGERPWCSLETRAVALPWLATSFTIKDVASRYKDVGV